MLWRSALADVGDHPLLGSGAGTFEQYWNEHRPRNYVAKDAHSLYLERLAEQGPVGLALILALVLYPLGVAVRYRRDPVVLTAVGVLVAFTVHAGFDWDWEMPAVTGLALVGASAIMLSARDGTGGLSRTGGGRRLVAATLAVGAVAFVGGSETRPSPRLPTPPPGATTPRPSRTRARQCPGRPGRIRAGSISPRRSSARVIATRRPPPCARRRREGSGRLDRMAPSLASAPWYSTETCCQWSEVMAFDRSSIRARATRAPAASRA